MVAVVVVVAAVMLMMVVIVVIIMHMGFYHPTRRLHSRTLELYKHIGLVDYRSLSVIRVGFSSLHIIFLHFFCRDIASIRDCQSVQNIP